MATLLSPQKRLKYLLSVSHQVGLETASKLIRLFAHFVAILVYKGLLVLMVKSEELFLLIIAELVDIDWLLTRRLGT